MDSLHAMHDEAMLEWEETQEKERPAASDTALGVLKYAQDQLALGKLKKVSDGPVGALTRSQGLVLVFLRWPDGAAFGRVWPVYTGWIIAPQEADALRKAWDSVREWCIAEFADFVGEQYDCADRIKVQHAAS